MHVCKEHFRVINSGFTLENKSALQKFTFHGILLNLKKSLSCTYVLSLALNSKRYRDSSPGTSLKLRKSLHLSASRFPQL